MSLKNKINNLIKSKTLFYELFAIVLGLLGFGNKYMCGKSSMYKAYTVIKRKYKKYIGRENSTKYNCKNMQNTIWFCWLQGLDSAPELIKNCYDSINYHKSDMNLILITKDNFKEYTELPDFIIDKWEKGIISNAHFSDILRLNLLLRHGGLWIDSTTYLTDNIPDYITGSDFFVYQDGFFNNDIINLGNWLIYSKPNNILLRETQKLLFIYWSKNNYAKNYFIFHFFFRMVTDYYSDMWNDVPYYNQIDQHIFQQEFLKTYNDRRFDQIKNISPIHKLTHKFKKENIEPNSYYSKLSSLYKN